jgi:hypothetical protein
MRRRVAGIVFGLLLLAPAATLLAPAAALFAPAATLLAPAAAWAKGGYSRPPDPRAATAGVSGSSASPGVILGGCGPKRVRDPVTQKCRGPADVGD